jgi:hypothetical protein
MADRTQNQIGVESNKQDKEEEEKRRLLTRSVQMESIMLEEDRRWRVDVGIVGNVR